MILYCSMVEWPSSGLMSVVYCSRCFLVNMGNVVHCGFGAIPLTGNHQPSNPKTPCGDELSQVIYTPEN